MLKLLKEERSRLFVQKERLKSLIKENGKLISEIEEDIRKEVNKELFVYLKNFVPKDKLKDLNSYRISFRSGLLIEINKNIYYDIDLIYEFTGGKRVGRYVIDMVDILRDISIRDIEVVKVKEDVVVAICHNIEKIFQFVEERKEKHANNDIISTKASVCLILKNYKSPSSSLNRFPRDIMVLICKKALSF